MNKIKYFYMNEALFRFKDELRDMISNDDYNKFVMNFDSSDMSTVAQLNHSVLKLNILVENKIYKEDYKKMLLKLQDAISESKTNILEIDVELEPIFVQILNKSAKFLSCIDAEGVKPGVPYVYLMNMRKQLAAVKYVVKLTGNESATDIDKLKADATKEMNKFRSSNVLVESLKSNTNDTYIEVPVI